MKRLTATLREQQAEAAKLDAAIAANPKKLGYGGLVGHDDASRRERHTCRLRSSNAAACRRWVPVRRRPSTSRRPHRIERR